jgi:PAS domain S-box-containing protein
MKNVGAIAAERVKRVRDIYLQTAHDTTGDELDALLAQGKWLHYLLNCLENLPLSVSIASVRNSGADFPIIFVNRAFEVTTQYPRSEVLGRDDSLLLCAASEKDQVVKIADALAKAEGIKIAVTHQRRNGSEFLDFLALRPVLTRADHEYIYVVAVQYDISKAEASLKEIKAVGDFLSLMSNILKA